MASEYNSDIRHPGAGLLARMAASRRLFAFAVVIVVAGILLKAGVALAPYIAQPMRTLRHDVDWGYLNTGLESTHGLRETGHWWTNTWCGAVPFWRPLTSYALWAMYLLWPPQQMLPREIVLVVLHLCFTGLAALLLWRLSRRRWLVLIALYLFAGWRPYQPGSPQAYVLPVHDVLLDPKNVPDPLVGLAIIGSLLLLTNGRWLAALALASLSVGFKESGFTTWPLAVIMLAWMRRDKLAAKDRWAYAIESLRVNSMRITAWVLVLFGLLFVHFMTVGVGYRQGSNDFWTWRIAVFFGWPMLSNLLLFDRTAAFMALFTFAAILLTWRRGLVAKTLAVLAAIALGTAADALFQQTSWLVSSARILGQGESVETALMCMAWLAVVWLARRRWRYVSFWLLMALVSAAPSWMAAQSWAHTRYVASVFMAMAIGAVLIENVRVIAGYLAGKMVAPEKRSGHGDT